MQDLVLAEWERGVRVWVKGLEYLRGQSVGVGRGIDGISYGRERVWGVCQVLKERERAGWALEAGVK